MIVVLDDTLEIGEVNEKTREWSKKSVIKDLFKKSKEKGYNKQIDVVLEDASISGESMFHTLGFVGLLSQAYSQHLPVVVAPHDFWFIANSELASIIAKNPEKFRHVFSAQESGKETLMIPTGNVTQIDYTALVELLEKKIPNQEIKDLMIPGLSTIDASVFYALCATLADSCQHYYSYMTFCCGIPKIKVRGEESDYRLLAAASRRLAEILDFSTEALTYYDRIAGLFDRMADSFTSEDPAPFWRDIFSQENVGSGGEKDINGWIRDFFTKRPARLESYETSIAAVPYKNLETQNEYLSLVGAFTAFKDSEGFWRMNFQEAVFQKVAAKDATPEVLYTSCTRTERTTHYSDGSKTVEPIPQKSPEERAAERAKLLSGWTFSEGPAVVAYNPQAVIKKVDESSNVGIASDPVDDLGAAYTYAVSQLMAAEDKGNPPLPPAGFNRGAGFVLNENGELVLKVEGVEKK